MQLAFEKFDFLKHPGKQGRICQLDEAQWDAFSALAEKLGKEAPKIETYYGYDLAVFDDDRMVAVLLAMPAEKLPAAGNLPEQSIFLEEMWVDPDYETDQMRRLLLPLALSCYDQTGRKRIYAKPEDEKVKALLFEQGFARIPRKELKDASEYALLQRGIGKHYQPRALLLIDYTNDFVATDGKLTTGEAGQAIETAIRREIERAEELGDLISILNDLHEEEDLLHPETALFPPHNLKGTQGRDLYGDVGIAVEEARALSPDKVFEWDKTRYSCFAGTPLQEILQKNGVDTLVLAGVCTDICVLHTAVDAYNLGYHIVVPKADVASFDAAGHAYALRHFENSLGADVLGESAL